MTHAVVLGAGMAGLFTARVLSEFYDKVTVVERDKMNRTEQFADPSALFFCLASRPFVEFHVRRRVAALGNVEFLDRHDAVAPTVVARERITGVLVVNRQTGVRTSLDADLVVDALGRGARTPAFLDNLGYGRPPEQRSAANWA